MNEEANRYEVEVEWIVRLLREEVQIPAPEPHDFVGPLPLVFERLEIV